MNQKSPKHLIFDFDGTIADSFYIGVAVVNQLAAKYGFKPITEETADRLRSCSVKEMIHHIGLPLTRLPFFVMDMKNGIKRHIGEIKPFAFMPECLHNLKQQGYSLHIVSTNAETNLHTFIQSHNLAIFDGVSGDSAIFGKAHAIKRYMKKHFIMPQEAVYIGDEVRDIEAARKIHTGIISVAWGYQDESILVQHSPDRIVRQPLELLLAFCCEEESKRFRLPKGEVEKN